VVAFTKDLTDKGLNANNVIKDISKVIEGSGGGRPDMALGGGKSLDKIDEMLSLARNIIEESLSKQ
jgi:alanyl-tRNA synthetase